MVLETLLSQHVFFFNTDFLYIALHSGISGQLYSDSIVVHIAWSSRPLGTLSTNIHKHFTPAYFTLVNQVLLTA